MTRPSEGPPDAGPPRLSAAPFIPPVVDPDVLAAQAARDHLEPSGAPVRRPDLNRRTLAALVDYLLLIGIAGQLIGETSLDPTGLVARLLGLVGISKTMAFTAPDAAKSIPLTLLVWILLRPFAIFAFTQTPGQFLMRYRVYAPQGGRVGLGKALLRELSVGAILVLALLPFSDDGVSSGRRDPDLVVDPNHRQLARDRIADTWPVLL